LSNKTLRDEIAMAALTGMLTGMDHPSPQDRLGVSGTQGQLLASWAYLYADCMLQARKTPPALPPTPTHKEPTT